MKYTGRMKEDQSTHGVWEITMLRVLSTTMQNVERDQPLSVYHFYQTLTMHGDNIQSCHSFVTLKFKHFSRTLQKKNAE